MAMIKVRAKRLGYDGFKRRREGEVFAIDDKNLSKGWPKDSSWLERLDGRPTPPKAEAAKPSAPPPATPQGSSDDVI